MALSGREQRQIFQTVMVRLRMGESGPPDSFTDEEKAWYKEIEQEILRDRKEGKIVNYSFPNDYDWDD